jgi:hypothetical protein
MIAGAASAQNPPAQQGPNNNAINTDQKNSDKPVAGRNSFTEGQAKSKIEDAGYSCAFRGIVSTDFSAS